MLMSSISPISLAFLGTISFLSAALIFLIVKERARQRPNTSRRSDEDNKVSFLFQGETLADATPKGQQLLSKFSAPGTERDRLITLLGKAFPSLQRSANNGLVNGKYLSANPGDDSLAEVECWDDMVRITLHNSDPTDKTLHPLAVTAMEEELTTLRDVSEHAPQLMWKEDSANSIIWANRAYLDLADLVSPNDHAWPPYRLFPTEPTALQSETYRRSVQVDPKDDARWFDLITVQHGTETIHFATDAGTTVKAERAARDFVQTLTKTFAQLSIGLAVFDKERHLVMFNPAILDLTGLPVDFLSGKPLIHSVLDRLRDRNMLPEPKNYKSWREQVSALESAAAAGTYCENWYLPAGQTLRVTGRPHPDGAIAFTFEDITAEVSLTRNFRSKLETSQNVIEAMDEAIAVFSAAGTLQMNNEAYAAFWGQTADGMGEINLSTEVERWQSFAAPSAVWQALRSISLSKQPRTAFQEELRLTDGRGAVCRCVPLVGGSLMVGFQITSEPYRQGSGEKADDVSTLSFRRA